LASSTERLFASWSWKPPPDAEGCAAAACAAGSASAVRPKMRQLLLLSPPPASAVAPSVVVDQLELAAAAEGAAGGGLGCGETAAVCVVGAACGSGAAGDDSVREPNQRVRRFPPLLALLGCSAPATEVSQAPEAAAGAAGAAVSPGLLVVVDHCGEALAVRVGVGSG
jgi:hypothetical protein